MARGKAATKVKLNFKDVETRRNPVDGDYLLRVVEAKKSISSNKNEQTELVFEVDKGSYKGAKVWLFCPHTDNSLWKLASVLEALGIEVPQDELEIDYEDLVDRKLMGVLTNEEYNGKKRAKLTDWAPASEYKGDDEDDKKSKKKKDKGAKEDKDAGKSKKDKKSKDEPEEKSKGDDDAKSDKKDKGGKDKKKAKPIFESDDIMGLSEKKLQKVIDEHELDVDLDDYKTDRKKAGAVIDALESKGLMKD